LRVSPFFGGFLLASHLASDRMYSLIDPSSAPHVYQYHPSLGPHVSPYYFIIGTAYIPLTPIIKYRKTSKVSHNSSLLSPLHSILYALHSTLSSNQTNQAAGLAVTALPKFPLSFPVDTTLATPLVGVGVEAILAVIDEILSTTFSLATIEPFTAPAITPAMIRSMKIDRQIVHYFVSSSFHSPLRLSLSFLAPYPRIFLFRSHKKPSKEASKRLKKEERGCQRSEERRLKSEE
jgi:hypothetical protein